VVGVLRNAGFEISTPTYQVSAQEQHDVSPGTGRNVIAQTRTGDTNRVVMIGAHLDSVPEGPGIVDNGSGVASLLEIATSIGASAQVKNLVRFGFFGNEETGSQGSTSYVDSLSAADRKATSSRAARAATRRTQALRVRPRSGKCSPTSWPAPG
jgi:aminopeptidase S